MADFFSYNLKTNKMEIMPHGESTIYEFETPLKFCLESINDPNSALSKILNTTSKNIFEAKDLIYMTFGIIFSGILGTTLCSSTIFLCSNFASS